MNIEKLFEIRTMRRVYQLSAMITLLCIFVPNLVICSIILMSGFPLWTGNIVIIPAVIIPLLLAPPLAIISFGLVRKHTLTVDKVDEYVRYDTLTGVLTRAYLLGKTREALTSKGGAFLMLDADHFKAVNDTYGHDVGDEALKKIAQVMRKATTTDAIIGRLGGEEFGIFLPGASDAQAAKVAQDLCDVMRAEGKVIAGQELNLTVSIGCAEHRSQQSLEKTMKLADAALYQAKRTGRDRYFVAGATDTMPALILKTQMKQETNQATDVA